VTGNRAILGGCVGLFLILAACSPESGARTSDTPCVPLSPYARLSEGKYIPVKPAGRHIPLYQKSKILASNLVCEAGQDADAFERRLVSLAKTLKSGPNGTITRSERSRLSWLTGTLKSGPERRMLVFEARAEYDWRTNQGADLHRLVSRFDADIRSWPMPLHLPPKSYDAPLQTLKTRDGLRQYQARSLLAYYSGLSAIARKDTSDLKQALFVLNSLNMDVVAHFPSDVFMIDHTLRDYSRAALVANALRTMRLINAIQSSGLTFSLSDEDLQDLKIFAVRLLEFHGKDEKKMTFAGIKPNILPDSFAASASDFLDTTFTQALFRIRSYLPYDYGPASWAFVETLKAQHKNRAAPGR